MGRWADYLQPGTETLRNKLGLTDPDELDRYERLLVIQRQREGLPVGDFDLTHLQAIHRHLFQDVYEWAGKLRTVDLIKDRTEFAPWDQLAKRMAEVHSQLRSNNYLEGSDRQRFTLGAAITIGDVNRIHPFREGNGRAQLGYLSQLGNRAGWPMDLTQIEPTQWIEASRDTSNGLYRSMVEQIDRAIETEFEREVREVLERRGRDFGERER